MPNIISFNLKNIGGRDMKSVPARKYKPSAFVNTMRMSVKDI